MGFEVCKIARAATECEAGEWIVWSLIVAQEFATDVLHDTLVGRLPSQCDLVGQCLDSRPATRFHNFTALPERSHVE